MVLTIARYSLREAAQNRLLGLALLLLLASLFLAEFIGAVALTEHRAIQATLMGSVLRLGAVVVLSLFVVSTLLREQQDRALEWILSLSRHRGQYVLGKLAAYFVLAAVLAAACAGLALLYAPPAAALRWGLSLACELWLVAAFGLLLAFTFRQPVTALATLAAIYGLARAMGALLLILAEPRYAATGGMQALADAFVQALSWVLPSLYRFTDAGWLAHASSTWGDLGVVLGQTGVYLPLLAAAAAFDLYRREF